MLVNIGGEGLLFNPTNTHYPVGYQAVTASVLDATGESVSIIGRLQLSDKSVSKSLAGATLWFRNASTTFVDAGSTFRFGIQDVNPATGLEDGTFDVYKDLIGGGGLLLNNTFQGHILDQGSKTVAHGDTLAIVFEFLVRAGADIIRMNGPTNTVLPIRGFPYGTIDAGSGPAKTVSNFPIALIVFSDGEIGRIDHSYCFNDPDQSAINNNSEIGLYFIAPFTGTLSKIIICPMDSVATTDFPLITIYSDPLGTPTQIYQDVLDPDVYSSVGSFSMKFSAFMLPTPLPITSGEEYVIGLSCSSGQVNSAFVSLGAGNSGMRKITALKENWCYASRDPSGGGAFTLNTERLVSYGFYMDAIDIGSGGGGEQVSTFG